jgi:hypothetical protein
MATASTQPSFTGPYKDLLGELATLMDTLSTEHGLSFVKAGDDKVYAFGGDGYVIVLDESRWQGLIEFLTPGGALTIKPDENGKPSVQLAGADEAKTKQVLKDGIEGVRRYYEKKYWKSPNV